MGSSNLGPGRAEPARRSRLWPAARKPRSWTLVMAGALLAVVALAAPAQAAGGDWSTSIPQLGDGTYACTGSRHDSWNMIDVQDCTRAVAGGSWQTVTVIANSSTHTAYVDMTIDAIHNGSVVGSVECYGTIPNKAQRACWGGTRHNPSTPTATSTVQAHDLGGSGAYDGTFNGEVRFVDISASYSPSRKVPA